MQEYFRRSRLSALLDGLGFHILTFLLSLLWFIWLWGLRLPAVTAGAALYGLIVLIRKTTRDDRVKRRETRLRRLIGGEIALERLLLKPPDQAHFETAMLLSLRHPLILLRTGQEGVLCALRGEKLLVAFAQIPSAASLDAGAVLALQRAVKNAGARRGVLCAPCALSPAAREQAQGEVPVSLLSRETLIPLFGAAHPATDSDLVALGRRKKRRPPRGWLHQVLAPQRARRYACYGALLLGMYVLTSFFYYAVPGILCVLLATACRCVKPEKESL